MYGNNYQNNGLGSLGEVTPRFVIFSGHEKDSDPKTGFGLCVELAGHVSGDADINEKLAFIFEANGFARITNGAAGYLYYKDLKGNYNTAPVPQLSKLEQYAQVDSCQYSSTNLQSGYIYRRISDCAIFYAKGGNEGKSGGGFFGGGDEYTDIYFEAINSNDWLVKNTAILPSDAFYNLSQNTVCNNGQAIVIIGDQNDPNNPNRNITPPAGGGGNGTSTQGGGIIGTGTGTPTPSTGNEATDVQAMYSQDTQLIGVLGATSGATTAAKQQAVAILMQNYVTANNSTWTPANKQKVISQIMGTGLFTIDSTTGAITEKATGNTLETSSTIFGMPSWAVYIGGALILFWIFKK
ncbi:MAG: hypothetical protein NT007_09555 [Candidatus Kapabacteria bacterium]|nr:hypothetical protein [Candidatus Kapabacteria bacterium]